MFDEVEKSICLKCDCNYRICKKEGGQCLWPMESDYLLCFSESIQVIEFNDNNTTWIDGNFLIDKGDVKDTLFPPSHYMCQCVSCINKI